jgi:uncharacterized protein YcbX
MRVDALWRYPVKSMGGEPLDAATVTDAGIEGDRAFALVDPEDGSVASAKHPRKWGALLHFRAAYTDGPGSAVAITFPDGSVSHSDDPDISDRIAAVLGRPATLTGLAPERGRYEAEWPAIDGVIPADFLDVVRSGETPDGGTLTRLRPKAGTFQDLAAMHLVAAATLDHLAALAPGTSFDVRRYRPNILVGDAAGGFVENGWTTGEITVGPEVALQPLVPTMRCIMTTLDQGGLPRDPVTLRTVAAHNRVEIPGMGTWACVGLYAEVARTGTIRVGDEVVT